MKLSFIVVATTNSRWPTAYVSTEDGPGPCTKWKRKIGPCKEETAD